MKTDMSMLSRCRSADIMAKDKEFEEDVRLFHRKITDADSKALDIHHDLSGFFNKKTTILFSTAKDRVSHNKAEKDLAQTFEDDLPKIFEFVYKYAMHKFYECQKLKKEIKHLEEIIEGLTKGDK